VAKRVNPKEIREPLFQQLVDDMFETMYAAPGVGLAAPQINVSKRIFVMDVHDDEHEPAVVINPKMEELGEEIELREGCLSVPGLVGEIARFKRAAVSGLDRYGEKIRIEGEGLLAQCLQHEIDHLNGALLHRSREEFASRGHRRGKRDGGGVKTLFFWHQRFAVPSLRVVAKAHSMCRAW